MGLVCVHRASPGHGKLTTKGIGLWPLSRALRLPARENAYTTLLMSTGLTFGTISALFRLANGITTQAQYTVLVTVVILSAVVPTLLAQSFFRPAVEPAVEARTGTAQAAVLVPGSER